MPPAKSKSNEKTWTVMVFMAAADSAALDAFAVRDLREMERGINAAHTNVVVQMNRSWPDTPQRYEVARVAKVDPPRGDSRFIPIPSKPYEEADGPSPERDLTEFVSWAKTEYSAKHYFLVLWGHAYGLGFGRSHNRSITMSGLRECLEHQKVDVIGANACAMSYVEAAYELRNCADYLVASQISVPFVGWPYESVLKQIDDGTSPEMFGRLIVDAYVGITTTASTEPVAMSLLSLKEAGALKGLVSEFAKEIRDASRSKGLFNSDNLNYTRDIFMGATYGDVRPLLDVVGLCKDFGDSESTKLKTAAETLQTFVLNTLRVDHRPARNDLNGVGIYAPLVGDDTDLKRLELQPAPQMLARTAIGQPAPGKNGKQFYEDLQIFAESKAWPQLVYDDLQHELSAEVMNSVASIDPSRLQDRRDVAQIVMAIGASFNKLDHLLATSERYVDREREGKAVTAFKAKAMPITAFGPPHLRLIQPVGPAEELALLQTEAELAGLRANTKKRKSVAAPSSDAPSVDVGKVVAFMRRVEAAIGNVETTVVRGLTNARFGLGPIGSSQTALGAAASLGIDTPKSGFGIDTPKSGFGIDTPKSGFGIDTPKSGFGGDTPKSGFGGDTPKSGFGMGGFGAGMSGDLRMDLALTRVVDLYRQVAEALFALEEAALSVEVTARTILSSRSAQVMSAEDLKRASVQQTERAFRLLEDASMGARRVVRRVLAHPIYGIGPGSSDLGLEERQLLARAGGLDRRSLRLM